MRKVLTLMLTVMFLLVIGTPAVFAKEPATPELSLSEVIERAIKNSKELKKANLDIEKADEKKEQSSDKLSFTPVIGGTYNPQLEVAWYTLLSNDLSYQMSKRNQNIQQDKLILDTCQKYWNVLKAQENVRKSEMNVKMMEMELQQVKAFGKVGMSPAGMGPQLALKQAEGAFTSAQSALVAAQNEIKNAYDNLNQQIGLWPQDRPVLIDAVEFSPVEIDDIEIHAQRVIESSPSVWMADEGVTMAKYSKELIWATGQYTPYKIRNIELEQAELDALSAKDAVKLATREMYYSVIDMEKNYVAVEQQKIATEEALRVTRMYYEVGMSTKLDVIKAETSLAELEKTLLDLTVGHAYMKLTLYKPWAVSPGA